MTIIDSGKIYQWMPTGEKFKRNRIKEKKKQPSLKMPSNKIHINNKERNKTSGETWLIPA